MSHVARCCCGALSMEVEGEPVANAVGHRTHCKRRTSAAFGCSVYFHDDQVSQPPADWVRMN